MTEQIQQLKLADIRPDPNNLRGNEDLTELIGSIKSHGILQPILVRKNGKGYMIISGERRWKALSALSKKQDRFKKTTIPTIIKDVDEAMAFEIQTIENLQREDLPPFSEATMFKKYVDKFGVETIDDLAIRVGCKPSYIKSRIAVFDLPEEIIDSWRTGEIGFGHLNTFLIVKDNDELLQDIFKDAKDGESVASIMRTIAYHSMLIADAIFDTVPCESCPHNSDRQKTLFGIGHEKAYCSNSPCYIEKTKTHLDTLFANPKNRFHKKFGTNGYRLLEEYRAMDKTRSFNGDSFEECKPCEHFITVMNMKGTSSWDQVCLNEDCYKKLKTAATAAERKDTKSKMKGAGAVGIDKPKVAWHGRLFREKFYIDRIPQKAIEINPLSVQSIHTTILALVISHNMRGKFQELMGINPENRISDQEILDTLTALTLDMSLEILRDLSVHAIMDFNGYDFTTRTRDAVATYWGIDIAAEWKPTEDYLMAKTRKELLAWIGALSADKKKAVRDFCQKKAGTSIDVAKKPDAVKAILGCGIDFTGDTPSEIANYDTTAIIPSNKKPGYEKRIYEDTIGYEPLESDEENT